VIGRWRRLGVVFPLGGFVLGARHRLAGPVDGGGLWRPGFCGNDDGGGDVGDAAMVEVVGSSPACPRVCLGLSVAVKSKLRRRGPVVYDDRLQVALSAIFRGASRAWFRPS
jgi:hypothetical protein